MLFSAHLCTSTTVENGPYQWSLEPATTTSVGRNHVIPQSIQSSGFFIFFILYFHFLQKYIFDLEIYRNIPRPPRCRAAGTWPPGSGAAGAFLKKNSRRKLRAGLLGPVAQQRGGRPWPPGCGPAGRNFCNLALFEK